MMIDQASLAIFVVPAIGIGFAAVLFVFTGLVDRRALRRADDPHRRAGR
ncbi:MAG: hypothetical protein ABR970_01300 [Roseiarcus sp.]|jgi:hypothetical protein